MKTKNITLLLYVAKILGGCDYYRVFKILYFAEMAHLVHYGSKITEDDFYALKYGPVPTAMYDQIKTLKGSNPIPILADCFSLETETALLALKEPALDFLSKSEIECIDKSIEENRNLSFSELKNKSHGQAWTTAGYGGKISPIEMAKEAGASPEMLEYISFVLDNQKPIPLSHG